jgi:hypothetical protein
MKKNSITNWILYGIDFDVALVPCLKTECDMWMEGECIQIRKAGKNRHLFDSITLSSNDSYIVRLPRFIKGNQLISEERRSVDKK